MAIGTVIRRPSRPAVEETDGQLLDRYVRHGEESAFAVLVRRHAPVVRGICRRVLCHEHDAEDVSQGTFLILARKADRVAWQASVRNWLCAVAYRLALHARRETDRQRRQVRTLADMHCTPMLGGEDGSPTVETLAFQSELRSVLDDELIRLPEKYRAPVVLCYLEGKTNEEAARLLGWPAGSMARRLARARMLLHQRLTQRGLALAIILICLVLVGVWTIGRNARSDAPVLVAQAMRQFTDSSEGADSIERTLHRLAETERMTGVDAVSLLRLANRTATVADMLAAHDPGPRRQEWTAYTEDMRRSAAVLAEAVEERQDERAVLRAARRLHASCQQCHEVFRR